ncbi:MAG: SAM-dependent methyltransferase [Gammaproteobacteria bacterium]|nr:SAM-dependent methyltransferase [Gammaproteobacteria bacterium]MBU1416279.1 SAM-dependent methyltransferase [Gammaproteobacteria bacterium]
MTHTLPEPAESAKETSLALSSLIAAEIDAAGGWISFARYMDLALHAPGLGYYGGGAHKFGSSDEGGDFVTAPELTPLFGQTLAVQVGQIIAATESTVMEVGAGSGRLAADLLVALDSAGEAPDRYLILELSGELRARQQAAIAAAAPALIDRVVWLDRLPEHFSGCVVANELLDAMPVHALAWRTTGLRERGVTLTNGDFGWSERPALEDLSRVAGTLPVTAPFDSEIGLAAARWVTEWGHRLERGALLLIDYGLPRHEYYHPGRNGGTLRCHYRHRSHDDVFWWPGLSDITTHIDFTAIAEAGHAAGLDVLGYTSQANFLINLGLGERLVMRREEDESSALRAAGAVQMLISPNEMGELFKVIALGREVREPLSGFARGDRIHTL